MSLCYFELRYGSNMCRDSEIAPTGGNFAFPTASSATRPNLQGLQEFLDFKPVSFWCRDVVNSPQEPRYAFLANDICSFVFFNIVGKCRDYSLWHIICVL